MTKQREDGRDEWVTPDDVYLEICRHWNVFPQIDVAASEENKKCRYYFDECSDALEIDWVEAASVLCVEPIFWMNPPYSAPLMTQFIEKAQGQAAKGATVLFLLPAFPDQNWYHDLIKQFPHEFWRGRIKFQPPAGIKPSTPRNGNIHGVIRQPQIHTSEIAHFTLSPAEMHELWPELKPKTPDWSDCL